MIDEQMQQAARRLSASYATPPVPPNSLPSGLDPDTQFVYGEDRQEFYQLQYDYLAELQPRTPRERFQVDNMIRNEWLLRRLFRAEAQLWETNYSRHDCSNGVALGVALNAASPNFMRLQRRITLAERAYKEASAALDRLQSCRRPPSPEPRPTPTDPPPGDLRIVPPPPASFAPEAARQNLPDQLIHAPRPTRSRRPQLLHPPSQAPRAVSLPSFLSRACNHAPTPKNSPSTRAA